MGKEVNCNSCGAEFELDIHNYDNDDWKEYQVQYCPFCGETEDILVDGEDLIDNDFLDKEWE